VILFESYLAKHDHAASKTTALLLLAVHDMLLAVVLTALVVHLGSRIQNTEDEQVH
jgi:hypothetical protein